MHGGHYVPRRLLEEGADGSLPPVVQDASAPSSGTGAADYVLLPIVRDEASVCRDMGEV